MPEYSGMKYVMEGQDNGVTIAATDTFMIGEVSGTGRVTEIAYYPEAATTGDNTHYRTFTLVNEGSDGSGSTVIGTLALTTGVNLAAGDEKLFTLSATAADLVVTAGDVLSLVSTPTGNGLVDPGGSVKVTIERAAA
jgi:hypothetical protein